MEFVGEAQDDYVAVQKVISGKVQLVYISPEAVLKNQTYRQMILSDANLKKLVSVRVDEAHCIIKTR